MKVDSVPRRVVLVVLVVAAAWTVAKPAESTPSGVRPLDESLLTVEDLPVGFVPANPTSPPTDLCGARLDDPTSPIVPRATAGHLFIAVPVDGTATSLDEEIFSFRPGDARRFAAMLAFRNSCPPGRFVRPDGLAVSGTVKPLSLRGLAGEVSAFQLCGPGSGRRLHHPASRVDQVIIRHGDHVGVLTYAAYGFFFDDGVRNRLAQEFSGRLASRP